MIEYKKLVQLQRANLLVVGYQSMVLLETIINGTVTQDDLDITERVMKTAVEQMDMLVRVIGGPIELEPEDYDRWVELKEKVFKNNEIINNWLKKSD